MLNFICITGVEEFFVGTVHAVVFRVEASFVPRAIWHIGGFVWIRVISAFVHGTGLPGDIHSVGQGGDQPPSTTHMNVIRRVSVGFTGTTTSLHRLSRFEAEVPNKV